MWKNITKFMGCYDFLSRIGFSLGDGRCIRFWWDEWIDGVVLKSAFPRIYALSTNKFGKVHEFGCLRNNVWPWKILLPKRVFGWELQQWLDLLFSLREFVVCDKLKDSFIWKRSPKGKYSTNLYCKSMFHSYSTDTEIWKLVWLGLAPPKVEVLEGLRQKNNLLGEGC